MNGDEVRAARFLSGDGYDASQVDGLLRRIAAELDAGRPAGPLIASAAFPRTILSGSRGYDTGAVDWFLDQLLRREESSPAQTGADPWPDLAVVNQFTRSGPGDLAERSAAPPLQALREFGTRDRTYLAEECADAWRDFGQVPGTQLRFVRAGALYRALRTAEQHTIASQAWLRATISIGERTFTLKGIRGSSRPGVAEIAARHAQDLELGHFLDMASLPRWDVRRDGRKPRRAQDLAPGSLGVFVDETGMPILYTSGAHTHEQAGACITLDERRWLRFPVRGTQRANAIMTAVDQAGNKIARYRLSGGQRRRNRAEVTVHPGQQLTDELVLAIAISAPWLSRYFSHPAPAGGG